MRPARGATGLRVPVSGEAGSESSASDAVLAGRPNLAAALDPRRFNALLVLVVAAALWVAAFWRESSGGSMDRFAVLLRFVALVATVRGALGLRAWLRALGLSLSARRHRLRLGPNALVHEFPGGRMELPKERIVAFVVDALEVHVVTLPDDAGEALHQVPALFERSPALLGERLRKWRGPVALDAIDPTPSGAPSALYDGATQGTLPPGAAVLRHGRGWLRRGPFAALLFALVFGEGMARLDADVSLGLLPWLAIGGGVLVPVLWLGKTLREIAPRKGLAMVVTPAEVLMRTEGGVLRAVFEDVPSIGVEERRGWSPLVGRETRRKLRLDRVGSPPIRYEEEFLGAPAAVVAALLDAFRARAQGRAREQEEEEE